ncbi:MAG: EamA family transporter [Erysipelotrichaceae bacterium]
MRTVVVFLFAWLMVGVVGSFEQIKIRSSTTLLFLVLSRLATGASWLCYLKALQLGNINQVIAVDKLSVVLTILLSLILFQEAVSSFRLSGFAES